MSGSSTYWSSFNLMARLFGLAAILFALSSSAAGIYYLIDPRAADGMETAGLSAGWLSLGIGAFFAAMGAVILRAKPYRPDLGDSMWTLTGGSVNQRRSWWTGAPE